MVFKGVYATFEGGILEFHFDEKARIAGVEIKGYGTEKEKDGIKSQMGIKKGDTFDEQKLEHAKTALKTALEGQGYYGSVVKARLVGVLNMEDESGMDEKLLALPIDKIDPTHSYVKDINDLSKHTLDKIKHFFETYKDLEPNKWVKVKGFENKESAIKVLEKAIKAYQG